jgi:hypothetical protein
MRHGRVENGREESKSQSASFRGWHERMGQETGMVVVVVAAGE